MESTLIVVREPFRLHPLAWIHRAEARAIAREFGASLVDHRSGAVPSGALLRLSDPCMRRVLREIAVPYRGPGHAALERCYDKLEATRIVREAGFDAPETFLADSSAPPATSPFILKPRRGSDSLGVRVAARVPRSASNTDHIVQARIVGREVTIGIFRERTGMPLEILLPRGTPYSFARKYLLRPPRRPLEDPRLRDIAGRIAHLLGVDWAARIDFIVAEGSDCAYFLECDAAPLVGPDSAFAASFAAIGVDRPTQLGWLVEP
jgi:D-alanine-D-alanine ligase-like ATP-grasp enzyme